MNKECTNLREELLSGKPVILFTTGTSMQPLLYDKQKKHATHVLVEPVSGTLAKGDLPIIQLDDGRYMIHRIIQVGENNGDDYYVTRGDNCVGSERIKKEAVFGVVTEIYRKGKTIKVTDKGYLCYVKIWTFLYPMRRICKYVMGILVAIKRKLS